jgi:peptidylprolyl isomerase
MVTNMNRAMLGDRVRVQCSELLKDGAAARWYCGRQMQFTVGSDDEVVAGISLGVVGMATGEQKRLALQPKDAYGAVRRELIKELPRTSFRAGLSLYVGKTLTAVGKRSGRRRRIRVVDLQPQTVVVDGNHPLAGKVLVVKLLLISLDSHSGQGAAGPSGSNVTYTPLFWQDIKEDHQCFRRLQQELRKVCALHRRSRVSRFAMMDLLAQFRDQLGMHFALEEAFAYFDDLLTVAPDLCEQADLLTAEHSKLFVEVCRLADDALDLACRSGVRGTFRGIARAYRAFDDRFQDHEARENELITRSFYHDIGVGG